MATKYNVPMIFCTKDRDCWYASSLMLFEYRRRKFTITKNLEGSYNRDEGLPPEIMTLLLIPVGLRVVPLNLSSQANFKFTNNELDSKLRWYGPLMIGLYMKQSGPHVVVITGIDDHGNVYLNDPNQNRPNRGKRVENLDWINDRLPLDIVPLPMMYLL